MINAAGPPNKPDQDSQIATGLASNALECLSVGNNSSGEAAGIVSLTWPGQAEQSRLILTVSGAEAAHTIKVNGQPVASVPIHPEGQPCRDGETFYIAIPPDVLVQGDNVIEITNDAMPTDSWTASQVRLEVLGRFPVLPIPGAAAGDVLAMAVTSSTITFTNPYDGTDQQARIVLPDDYSGDPVPLVIYVHGRSSDMYEGENTIGEATRNKGWLLATPQLHGSWPYPPDPPGKYAYASLESQYDIIGAMNYMLDHYNVITDRIYLVGYSMGGQIATVTAGKFPHVFAAVFDNKGPTNMAEWYYEQAEYYESFNHPHVQAMRQECHVNELERDPTENPFCYQRRSGVNFASNYIHMPISITHSVSDTLVPIHHSRDFRDAVNSYSPDRPVTVYEDTIIGPTCGEPYHCYEPDPMDVLNFLEQFTLNNNPTSINITTDESKSYHWLNVIQTGGDHWSQVQVAYYPITATVTALISDTAPLTLAFNLGSTALTYERISDKLKQPGMGLPATTYLIKGGDNNYLHNYESGYLTTTLSTTGEFGLTISAITVDLSAYPDMVSGWQTSTSAVTAIVRDHLDNPVPDGTIVEFSATEGTFPNGGAVYTATVTGGQVTTTLTLPPEKASAEIAAWIGSVTNTTTINVIYPSIEMTVTPDRAMVYSGQMVTYTYQITNTGDVTLTDVTVEDDNGTPEDSGDDVIACTGLTLAPEAMAGCSRNATLTHTVTNKVTVTGLDPLSNDISDEDTATISIISPAIEMTVTPDQAMVYSGQMVTYTYQITNTGDVTLTDVTVEDDNGTPDDDGDDLTVCTGITLEAGATTNCSRLATLTETTVIIATATGQDPLGNAVVASDAVTITVQPPEEIPTSIYLPVVMRNSSYVP
ncbi:MAG: prolyl oligopeptidase family serine peptidase [Anaerolineae bacterium]|nr:prolyl oligopeptidase family serine peptidase [Anaerolineae bacterium]